MDVHLATRGSMQYHDDLTKRQKQVAAFPLRDSSHHNLTGQRNWTRFSTPAGYDVGTFMCLHHILRVDIDPNAHIAR